MGVNAMTQTLKLEVTVDNIGENGTIASTFATTDFVQTELNKKVNLTPEGKVDHTQLPDYTYISGLPEAMEDERQLRTEAESAILEQANTYSDQKVSEFADKKADLVKGLVPFSQLPYSLNLEANIAKEFVAVRNEIKQTSDDILVQIVQLDTSLTEFVKATDTARKDYIDRAYNEFVIDVNQNFDREMRAIQLQVEQSLTKIDDTITDVKKDISDTIIATNNSVTETINKAKLDISTSITNSTNTINQAVTKAQNDVSSSITNMTNTVNNAVTQAQTDIASSINGVEAEANELFEWQKLNSVVSYNPDFTYAEGAIVLTADGFKQYKSGSWVSFVPSLNEYNVWGAPQKIDGDLEVTGNIINARNNEYKLAACALFISTSGIDIKSSFNIRSISLIKSGHYLVNFTEPMRDTNYILMATGSVYGNNSVLYRAQLVWEGDSAPSSYSPARTVNSVIISSGSSVDTPANGLINLMIFER